MLSSTSTDFRETPWRSSRLRAPAPGSSRSITYLGMMSSSFPACRGWSVSCSVRGRRTHGHDRDTVRQCRDTGVGVMVEPLRAALEGLRLEGAIFFRGEFSEAWAFESPDGSMMAALLHPGAPRIIIFHVVAQGTCWIEPAGGERHWATTGDVIALP